MWRDPAVSMTSSADIRAVLDALSVQAAIVDRSGAVEYANAAWRGSPPESRLSARFAQAAERGLRDVLDGRRKVFLLEYPADRDGDQRWFSMRISAIEGPGGGALVRHLDITDRKRTERSLLESEQRFRAIFEMSLDAILIGDEAGIIIDANNSACALLGAPRVDLVGLPAWHLFRIDYDKYQRARQRLLDEGELRGEFMLVTGGGREIDVEFTARPRVLPGLHMLTLRDVSRRKQLEQQVLQAQKMETVGRLAGGVAHDFNNLLTAILGYAELLVEDDQDEATRRDNAIEIRTAALRAAVLTRQLLTFSRHESARPQRVNLNGVITSMRTLLSRMLGEHMIIATDLAEDLPPVLADLGQMEQVIANLAVNARDAMPDGGEITFATRAIRLESRERAAAGDAESGTYVEISVSDNGHGIPAEIQPHIFEPFFTTKDQGKGTGLGLSTVYGIVTGSGGHIIVDTAPDKGTTFRVRLPVVIDPA